MKYIFSIIILLTVRWQQTHSFIWIDLYDSFANEKGYLRESLTDDGLHLNQQGYLLWSEILKKIGRE